MGSFQGSCLFMQAMTALLHSHFGYYFVVGVIQFYSDSHHSIAPVVRHGVGDHEVQTVRMAEAEFIGPKTDDQTRIQN
jgi:hypothetical protein